MRNLEQEYSVTPERSCAMTSERTQERGRISHFAFDIDGTIRMGNSSVDPFIGELPAFYDVSILTARMRGGVMNGPFQDLRELSQHPDINWAFANGAVTSIGGVVEETVFDEGRLSDIASLILSLNPEYIVAQVADETYAWFSEHAGNGFLRHLEYNGDHFDPLTIFLRGDVLSLGLLGDRQYRNGTREYQVLSEIHNLRHIDVPLDNFFDKICSHASKVTLCDCKYLKDGKFADSYIASEVADTLQTSYTFSGSNSNLQVLPLGVNKLAALNKISERKGVPLSETLFAGNDYNDEGPLFCPELGARVFVGSLATFQGMFQPFRLTDGFVSSSGDYLRVNVQRHESDKPIEIFLVPDPSALINFTKLMAIQQTEHYNRDTSYVLERRIDLPTGELLSSVLVRPTILGPVLSDNLLRG